MTPAERAAEAACLALQPSDMAITLTWNEWPITLDRARRDLRQLHARIDRQLLGRRFNRYPLERRSRFWAITEKLESYPHAHIGWRAPPGCAETLEQVLLEEWRAVARGGECDLRTYHPDWPGYAAKALADPHDIIHAEEFLPST